MNRATAVNFLQVTDYVWHNKSWWAFISSVFVCGNTILLLFYIRGLNCFFKDLSGEKGWEFLIYLLSMVCSWVSLWMFGIHAVHSHQMMNLKCFLKLYTGSTSHWPNAKTNDHRNELSKKRDRLKHASGCSSGIEPVTSRHWLSYGKVKCW